MSCLSCVLFFHDLQLPNRGVSPHLELGLLVLLGYASDGYFPLVLVSPILFVLFLCSNGCATRERKCFTESAVI